MDGPNVNWAFINHLRDRLDADCEESFVDVGSCGIHTLHGAFKTGCQEAPWRVDSFLSSLFYLFHHAPARREDYTKSTGSDIFPLKFCAHRWIENVPVAERALEILSNVSKFVKAVDKKAIPNPKTSSYETVKTMIENPLLEVYIKCYLSIAKIIKPFLVKYQTDAPMMPFLSTDLYEVMKNLAERVVKSDVMRSIGSSHYNMVKKLDLNDSRNLKDYKHVDLGFAGDKKLKELLAGKVVSERQVLELRMECRAIIVKIVAKLQDKSPLKYALVRNLSCLDPKRMVLDRDGCVSSMRKVLGCLVKENQMKEGKCDEVLQQFGQFIDDSVASSISEFKNFNQSDRVDKFLYLRMANERSYNELWVVTKKLLLLSHGQASVERGFSVNKALSGTNMHERSVVAQRIVFDHIESVGGVTKVGITKELMQSFRSAHSKYQLFLEEQRQKAAKEHVSKKRKRMEDELEDLLMKKQRLDADAKSLIAEADKYAEKAEATKNFLWITKSNSLRSTAKSKLAEAEKLESKIQEQKMRAVNS